MSVTVGLHNTPPAVYFPSFTQDTFPLPCLFTTLHSLHLEIPSPLFFQNLRNGVPGLMFEPTGVDPVLSESLYTYPEAVQISCLQYSNRKVPCFTPTSLLPSMPVPITDTGLIRLNSLLLRCKVSWLKGSG